MIGTISTLWGWLGIPVCLGEVDDVLVAGDLNGSLVADPARAAPAARYGCNFVDEMFYLRHLADGAEREGKESEGGIETSLAPLPIVFISNLLEIFITRSVTQPPTSLLNRTTQYR